MTSVTFAAIWIWVLIEKRANRLIFLIFVIFWFRKNIFLFVKYDLNY